MMCGVGDSRVIANQSVKGRVRDKGAVTTERTAVGVRAVHRFLTIEMSPLVGPTYSFDGELSLPSLP